ncbi:Hexuronate transporter [Frigoriglobus tundricola]|uniref:Hexuronate transporter n=2 Tax=Frigoriglobus tundricola TaxID=2774151 RepID=A0A6M5YTJ0_9BACT|nr:Hexuronate transporter [Frigoriglobus tundricola]
MMLATLLNYMDRQVLPQIATELKDDYGLNDARYGQVAGNFALAFAAGSIFFGFIADRIGPRLLYPVVLIGWSAAGLATPLMRDPTFAAQFETPDEPGSGPYQWLLLCRTLLGFFEAGHWPCALLTARQILTATDRPLGNGLLQSGAAAGAILVPLYVLAVRTLGGGWEIAFWTIGAAGLLWVPVWLALVRRGDLDHVPPVDVPAGAGGRPTPQPPFTWDPFVRAYVTLFAINLGINVSWQFIREWLPKYLKESQRFSANATDVIVPFYYISGELGCFAAGVLVRWLVARGRAVHSARVSGYALFAAVTAAAALAPFVGGGWPGVALLVLAGAGILGLHPLYYALSQELPAKHMALLSGVLTAAGWSVVSEVQKGMGRHIRATGSYEIGFVIAGLAPIAGLVALLVLWKPAASSQRA